MIQDGAGPDKSPSSRCGGQYTMEFPKLDNQRIPPDPVIGRETIPL